MDDKTLGDLLTQWKLLSTLLSPTLRLIHALQIEEEFPLLLQADPGFAEGFLQLEEPLRALLRNQDEMYTALESLVRSMEEVTIDAEIGNRMILDRLNLLRSRRGAEKYEDLSGSMN